MVSKSHGGKRSQAQRATETIKSMLGEVESEIARHREELARLIEDGRVSPIFGGASMRYEVFDMWLWAEVQPDPTRSFVLGCGMRYCEMRREMPDLVALKEHLAGLSRKVERRSAVEDAVAFLDGRATRPLESEIDEAVRRGELSSEAAILARHGWELHQRFQAMGS